MAVRSKKEFADELREAAKKAGCADGSALADRTGINASTIRTWFRGKSEPRFLQLASLAEIIHAPLDKLAYSDSSEIVADVGEDVWRSFTDGQRAGILRCVRLLSKLNQRLFPDYDPVAMFAATLQGTSDMCDSFVGKLPPGTLVSVDASVAGRRITSYEPPPADKKATRVSKEPAKYGKKHRSK